MHHRSRSGHHCLGCLDNVGCLVDVDGQRGNTVIVSNATTSIVLPDLNSPLLDGAKYTFIFEGTSGTTFTVNTTGLFCARQHGVPNYACIVRHCVGHLLLGCVLPRLEINVTKAMNLKRSIVHGHQTNDTILYVTHKRVGYGDPVVVDPVAQRRKNEYGETLCCLFWE